MTTTSQSQYPNANKLCGIKKGWLVQKIHLFYKSLIQLFEFNSPMFTLLGIVSLSFYLFWLSILSSPKAIFSISLLLPLFVPFSSSFFIISYCIRLIGFPLLCCWFWRGYILSLWIDMLPIIIIETDCIVWFESMRDHCLWYSSFSPTKLVSILMVQEVFPLFQIHSWCNCDFQFLNLGCHILW